jgi:uncharacterized membrane protein (Fun14 family)
VTEVAPAAAAAKVVRAGIPMWAKALVAASIGLMGIGIATPIAIPSRPPPATTSAPSGNSGGEGVTGLVQGGQPGQPAPVESRPSGIVAWSPTIFALGFSFFVGFAMACALRMFLRLALVGFGFFFMLMFGLQYAGLIEVKWAAMETKYDTLAAHLNEDAHSATDYITAYLPSAASASAGLVAGFWRRR